MTAKLKPKTPARKTPAKSSKKHPILALLDAPETDDGVVLEAAAHGPDGVKALLTALTAKRGRLDGPLRTRAVYLLGELSCLELAKHGEALLDDEHLDVGYEAIYSLMLVDAEGTAPLLLARLAGESHDEIFKGHAVRALFLHGDEKARKEAEALLDDQPSDALRTVADTMIAVLSGQAAIPGAMLVGEAN